jgi:hypothetical protein
MGYFSGATSQGTNAVAIGYTTGGNTQGSDAIAVGSGAGNSLQGASAVAVGRQSGNSSQGSNSVAVGNEAGRYSQGVNAVAIGYLAGYTGQHANTIIVNASGSTLNSNRTDALFVRPIRNTGTSNFMFYDPSTYEVSYSNTAAFVSGSIGNLTVTDTLTTNLVKYTNTIRISTGTYQISPPFYSKYLVDTPTGTTLCTLTFPQDTDLTDGLTLHIMNVSPQAVELAPVAGTGTTVNFGIRPQNTYGWIGGSAWYFYDLTRKNWSYQNLWY